MSKDEEKILKAVIERGGLLSPADLINGIARQDRKSVENLVVNGFLEEVPQDRRTPNGVVTINFYRATAKGLLAFESWRIRLWKGIKADIHIIVVSIITACVTSIVAIFLGKILKI